jgi:hypothetical protein
VDSVFAADLYTLSSAAPVGALSYTIFLRLSRMPAIGAFLHKKTSKSLLGQNNPSER